MIAASVADIAIISALAGAGLVLHSLPACIIAGVLAAAIVFALLLDLVKVPVFRRLHIAPPPDSPQPPPPRAVAQDDGRADSSGHGEFPAAETAGRT